MRKLHTFTVLAGALLALFLIAGCGGDDGISPEEYSQEIQDVLEPLGTELQTLGSEVQQVRDADAFASAITDVQDTLEQGISDLEAIDPPEDAEDAHADMIAAFESFNESLDGVREAAEEGDVQALQNAASQLPQAALDFQSDLSDVTQRLEDAGVPVGEDTSNEGE
jgi:soluble cytochrome b562